MFSKNSLQAYDPELYQAVQQENQRQEQHIELIASENYTSPLVMELQGSQLTNKYAEGYPNKRYYGGCEYVDIAESLAIDRAKELFNADFANVQAHSGSSANLAAFQTFLEPGETFLGMSLAEGGHLTHGSPVNFSGSIYNCISYGVDAKTGLIDYNQVEDLAKKHKPKMIIAGFSAYSRIIDWSIFADIAKQVNAKFLVDMAHVSGLVATGLYPNPVPYADAVTSTTHKSLRGPRSGIIIARSNPEVEKKLNSKIFPGNQGGPLMHVIAAKAVCFKEAMEPEFKVYQQQVVDNASVLADTLMQRGFDIVSDGTDNHLMLVSLVKQQITGKDADRALGEAHITVNKNTVPNDPQSPFVTSGIRLGTPAITTRGFGIEETKKTGNLIADVLDDIDNESVIDRVKSEVAQLCNSFPVYR